MPMSPSPRPRPQRKGLTEHDRTHDTALVILDMISCWSFPGAPALARAALEVTPAIARLKRRCVAAGMPVIYANDNSGQWRSDFKFLVRSSLESGGPGSRTSSSSSPSIPHSLRRRWRSCSTTCAPGAW